MRKLSTDFWLCAVGSVLWFIGGIAAMAVFPTVLSVGGSFALGIFFAIRAVQYAQRGK